MGLCHILVKLLPLVFYFLTPNDTPSWTFSDIRSVIGGGGDQSSVIGDSDPMLLPYLGCVLVLVLDFWITKNITGTFVRCTRL